MAKTKQNDHMQDVIKDRKIQFLVEEVSMKSLEIEQITGILNDMREELSMLKNSAKDDIIRSLHAEIVELKNLTYEKNRKIATLQNEKNEQTGQIEYLKTEKNQIQNTFDQYKQTSTQIVTLAEPNEKNPIQKYSVVIVTTELIESIAQNMARLLKSRFRTKIIYYLTDVDLQNTNPDTLYVILYNQRPDKCLPANYVIYQIEQSNSDLIPYYAMPNACAIWDFSPKNYDNYCDFIPVEKVRHIPLIFSPEEIIALIQKIDAKGWDAKGCDILFYGTMNERRTNILNALNRMLKHKYLMKWGVLLGDNRDYMIQNSRLVLNLHFYEDAALETARLNEILRFDRPVLSETTTHPKDWYNRYLYQDLVEFVDIIDEKNQSEKIQEMAKQIDRLLSLPDAKYSEKINHIKNKKRNLSDKTGFLLNREICKKLIKKDTEIMDVYDYTIYGLFDSFSNTGGEFFEGVIYKKYATSFDIYPSDSFEMSYTNLFRGGAEKKLPLIAVSTLLTNPLFEWTMEKYAGGELTAFLRKIVGWDLYSCDFTPNHRITQIYKYEDDYFLEIIGELDLLSANNSLQIYSELGYSEWMKLGLKKSAARIILPGSFVFGGGDNSHDIIINPLPFMLPNCDIKIIEENLQKYSDILTVFLASNKIVNVPKNAICCIYCYYEKSDDYRENFREFLKNAILDHIDYYLIINGSCSIQIPDNINVKVYYRENRGYDFGAYAFAINKLFKSYEHYFFLNTSVIGPYYHGDWSAPFIELFEPNVKVVGTSINIFCEPQFSNFNLKKMYGKSQPFPHVQSMFFAIDREYFLYLTERHFFSESELADKSFEYLVAHKEIGLSQLAISNGWNINCILQGYRGLDYRTITKDVNPTSQKGDPYYPGAFFGGNIEKTDVIFYKKYRLG